MVGEDKGARESIDGRRGGQIILQFGVGERMGDGETHAFVADLLGFESAARATKRARV